ncbi:MAG: FtsX-like permease family protein [bacterium]|nr:FtsX-like permease family protein [bacterium]
MNKPPKILESILLKLIYNSDAESLPGDFEEMYLRISEGRGNISAILWYLVHIVKLIPPLIKNLTIRSGAMLKNYIKISVRNILRNKNYTFLNIAGLSLGMACSIIISLYVMFELSYDKYHENYKRIHRIAAPFSAAISSGPLGPALKEEIPEIEKFVRIYVPTIWSDQELVSSDEKSFYTDRFFFADPSLFEIFTFSFIKGDPSTVFSDPRSIVINESIAAKFFGKEDPIGKVIRYENELEFFVTGVIKDMPRNSHFKFDLVAPLTNNNLLGEPDWEKNWDNSAFVTYLLLPEGFNTSSLASRIPEIIKQRTGRQRGSDHFIQPLERIHLHSKLGKEIEVNGDIRNVQVFSAIALLILLIACLNYINLSTAQATVRSKEVGLRKVVGARRFQLITQFLGESVIISLLSFIAAICIASILLPVCIDLFDMNFDAVFLKDFSNIMILLIIAVITGIMAGCFPAFILSSFNPGSALKSGRSSSKNRFSVRNHLVVFQLVISVSLIICTWIIYQQNSFILNSELGFDEEQIVVLQTGRREDVKTRVRILEEEIRQNPGVVNVSASVRTPGRRPFWRNMALAEGSEEDRKSRSVQYLATDYGFIDTYKMEILAGRDFSREHPEDEGSTFILNETAIRLLGFCFPEEAIGRQVIQSRREGKIIGVVRDYHFVSMHTEIAPIVMNIYPNNLYTVSVKINTENISNTLGSLEKSWKKVLPDMPFKFFFLDEAYSSYYHSERKSGKLMSTFTVISILITCLGLFGLASFSADRRRKEIGVRKVLGASVPVICNLMIHDYLRWIVIANLIAWPIAYFTSNIWLQSFAYKINIGLMVFILSGLITFLIVIITIGYKSMKAAKENPVKSLRYE